MSEDIKKGLVGIVVDETTISQVMPEINSLTYRGYTVQELCDKCVFEEVAYLVLNGELPNPKQLKKFLKDERSSRNLSKQILQDLKKMPKKAHPMDVIRTVVSLMALEDKDTSNNSKEANMRKALRIFAAAPTAVAAYFRIRKGKKIIRPDKKLSFSENFLKMMLGKVPDKEIVKAFDVSMILYAEHSFNVSTFTARTITSSLSDMHGEITDIPLIEYVASKGKPVIISTGIAELNDIELALDACKRMGNNDIALLKCTSSYPAPINEANMSMVKDLADRFDVISGLSDHTMGSTVPVVATCFGAKIIEKHFIIDRSIGGPDASFSMNEAEFTQMVKAFAFLGFPISLNIYITASFAPP